MSKTRANGDGNIRQRSDGRWEVRVTLGLSFTTGEPTRISRYVSAQEETAELLHELSTSRIPLQRTLNPSPWESGWTYAWKSA